MFSNHSKLFRSNRLHNEHLNSIIMGYGSFVKYACFLIPLLSFSCKPKVCHLVKIKTLYVGMGVNAGVDTSYAHYVLLEGFSKECLDSSSAVNIAHSYLDTTSGKRPIDLVMFYGSDADFPKVGVPYSNNLDKECLVKMFYNEENKKIYSFIFYNNEGKRTYWGNRWKAKNNYICNGE